MSQEEKKVLSLMIFLVLHMDAMYYIGQNVDRELSLIEIAEVAAFFRFHLHRIVKNLVEETVTGFTRRLRIEMAAV